MKFTLPFIAAILALAGIVKALIHCNPVNVPAAAANRHAAHPASTATASK